MKKIQEPKYDFTEMGYLQNRATGDVIPTDEPVFIFRAKDAMSIVALSFYATQCKDELHKIVVRQRIVDFLNYQINNPDKVKEPDSSPSCLKS